MQLPLGNGYYVSTSPTISNELCTNWYPNYPQSPALSEQTLLPTPGITFLGTTQDTGPPDGPNRGGIVFDGKPYVINGESLWRIDEITFGDAKAYIGIKLGFIDGADTSTRVSIAKNNTQICIVVPGKTGYIYSVANGLEEIISGDYRKDANVVTYLDGYFIFATDTVLFSSALNDGTTFNIVDFASAEADPDDIVTLHTYKNQLYVFGVDITEVFQNVGNPTGFPLQRISGFIVDKGAVGIFAVTDFEDSLLFVGSGLNERAAIWRLKGSEPEKISTTAIDKSIDKLGLEDITLTVGLSYAQDGAYFGIFELLAETFVYDSTASNMAGRPIWHTRESYYNDVSNNWRVNVIMEAYGRQIVADKITNDIGALEIDTSREYGNRIDRTWSSMTVAQEDMRPVFVSRLRVNVEAGLTNETDARLGMALSSNGGKSYDVPTFRSMGKLGEYDARLVWDRLGRFPRYVTFKLTYSGNSRCVIVRADVDIK